MEIFQPSPYTFLGLLDVPHTYSGSANKTVSVNSGATGLTFSTTSGSGLNAQTPVGTVNSSNKTFTTTGIVTIAIADSVIDSAATILGSPNSTITYSVPPQNNVYAF